MIRINLLPIRAARKKENIRWQVSVFLLMVMFGLVVVAYGAFDMTRRISNMNSKIQEAEQELTELEMLSNQVREIKDKLKQLQAKMDIIQRLEVNRTRSVRILDSMTGLVIADRMWLSSLTDKNGSVNMKGMAMDNKTIADFMKRLEGSPFFKNVNLIASKQVQNRELAGKFKEFTITCQSQMPTTPEKVKAS
jgi:type IV pilus assembly protein PilN